MFGGLLDGKIKNKIETKFGKCDRETIELANKSNDSIALLLGSMYFWSFQTAFDPPTSFSESYVAKFF